MAIDDDARAPRAYRLSGVRSAGIDREPSPSPEPPGPAPQPVPQAGGPARTR